jgi:CRP/FNR family transcriptional regulator
MGPGDFFGEIALIDHGPRSATVTASSPMRLLILGSAQFQDVLHQDPDMARQLLYAVTKRLRAAAAAPLPAD